MKIENEKIKLATISLPQIKINGAIFGMEQEHQLKLSNNQLEVLQMMADGHSIAEIVKGFLEKRILLSFERLLTLVQFMVEEKLILNPSFTKYFRDIKPEASGFFDKLSEKIFGKSDAPIHSVIEELGKVPFLRGLDTEILKTFTTHSQVIECPSDIMVCEAGKKQRSLLVLLRGQASVYKRSNAGLRRKIATLNQDAVFGEVGFFLGEPRTADVVTDTDCLLLRIKYVPELYDSIINGDKARQLQKRIWLIHALLNSTTFRDIPDDCFDALIFSGELKTFPGQSVICKEGDPGASCYIVVQGSLVVSKNGASVQVLEQGDVFGEIALIVTGGTRSASVQAQSEVLALEIPAAKFYDLLAQNLALAAEIEKVALQRIRSDKTRQN